MDVINRSSIGFIASMGKDIYLSKLREYGIVGSTENLVKFEERGYVRGGAECFFSEFKVTVADKNNNNISNRHYVAKAWLSTTKGKMINDRRTLLSNAGMKTLPVVSNIPSESNPEDIRETIEPHASSSAFEKKTRVKDASEDIDRLSENDAKELGKIAAILDHNRFSPTRILADVIFTDSGVVFNDFGYDLGDQGKETQTYFGCEIKIDYKEGRKCLEYELRKHPGKLSLALASYENHMSEAGKKLP